MLLDRLESGLLLFETPQGLVPVELSLWQRAYLLWTFRNFRRLSLPLLNSRQASMVRGLAQKNPGRVSRSYDPSLVIGVVESFKFAPVVASTPAGPKAELSTAAEPATAEAIATSEALQTIGEKQLGVQPVSTDGPSEELQPEIGARPRIAGLRTAWLKTFPSKIDLLNLTRPRFTSFKPASPMPALFKLGYRKLQISYCGWIKSEWPKLRLSHVSASQLATAAGVLLLCIGSIVAWHRMGVVAGSEAHTRPSQIEPSAQVASQSLNASELRQTSASEHWPGILSPRPKSKEEQESSSLSPVASRGSAAIDVVKPAAKTDVIASLTEHQLDVQNQTSVPKPVPEDSEIQATRPPLRSWYPDYSGIEARGIVVLSAEVDSDGMVRSVRVLRGNRALAAAAVRAVRQWRYAPYLKEGKPVPTETNIVISVFADDAVSMSFPPSIAAIH